MSRNLNIPLNTLIKGNNLNEPNHILLNLDKN
ncbi:hypothetical protein E4650_00290 [Geotoga petraea]|uniref:Uncharacterized protein n=1 Tax=Geotoga petraea TaxID=28234 RepID=A0A4Z0W8I5_9BACT|nr:hypothetical protein E4650_00290 [Geotoga petraea]